jgi:hypothetical protein
MPFLTHAFASVGFETVANVQQFTMEMLDGGIVQIVGGVIGGRNMKGSICRRTIGRASHDT